jgi:hypothetical protein
VKAFTYYDSDVILAFFRQHMTMDLRRKLMSQHPQAYNRWVQQKVVKVVYNDDEFPKEIVDES